MGQPFGRGPYGGIVRSNDRRVALCRTAEVRGGRAATRSRAVAVETSLGDIGPHDGFPCERSRTLLRFSPDQREADLGRGRCPRYCLRCDHPKGAAAARPGSLRRHGGNRPADRGSGRAGRRRGARRLQRHGWPGTLLAWKTGCDITGPDVTASRVEGATELTRVAGLSGSVRFVHGNALAMPFQDASFTLAIAQESFAHIPDKPRLLAECARSASVAAWCPRRHPVLRHRAA